MWPNPNPLPNGITASCASRLSRWLSGSDTTQVQPRNTNIAGPRQHRPGGSRLPAHRPVRPAPRAHSRLGGVRHLAGSAAIRLAPPEPGQGPPGRPACDGRAPLTRGGRRHPETGERAGGHVRRHRTASPRFANDFPATRPLPAQRRAFLQARPARPYCGSVGCHPGGARFRRWRCSGVCMPLWAMPPTAARALSPSATKPPMGSCPWRVTIPIASALRAVMPLFDALPDRGVHHPLHTSSIQRFDSTARLPRRGGARRDRSRRTTPPSRPSVRRPCCHACSTGQPVGFSAAAATSPGAR